jgi:hypothetical protein
MGRFIAQATRHNTSIYILLLCVLSIASCQSQPVPKTVERKATVQGCTDAIIAEHDDLFAENIRLKQALQVCQEKH